MSEKIGNVAVIQVQADDVCEMCGKTAELKPYGPMGERIKRKIYKTRGDQMFSIT